MSRQTRDSTRGATIGGVVPVPQGRPWRPVRNRATESTGLVPDVRSGAVELGSRRRPGDPVGVRAGARSARHRHDQGSLRPVHRRPRRAGAGRRHVRHGEPGDRGDDGPGRQGHPGRRRQGGPRRAPRADPLVGNAPGQGTRQVPVPDRAHPPGAVARVRRPRIDGLGQADQGEPRRRRPARGGSLLVLRGLGGQARVRLPGSRRPTARCRGADHPVELPAADAGLEDRPGARRREHGRPQARLDDPAVGPPVRGRVPPGRPAARGRQHRHRPGRDRDGAGHPSRASTRSPSPARPRSASASPRASPAPTRR